MQAREAFAAAAPVRLAIEHVSKSFHTTSSVHALEDVSLQVKEGEFLCLVRPSGRCWSTLLDIIVGLKDVGHLAGFPSVPFLVTETKQGWASGMGICLALVMAAEIYVTIRIRARSPPALRPAS
jgi:ABC-type uncharacterized transport system ATPase subunit